uniref:Peroxisomal biogenesis factor 3 n=1 Tax=Ascaris suum TaxID=6253 RepID=F1L7E9_ASCSU
MSSIWQFIKRHRGKLLVGGAIAGAAYAIHTVIQNMHEQQQLMQQFKTDPLRIQARRHYVYDTNQRACDKSIVELTQCMAKRILLRFDVESAIAALRGEPQLSNEQRLQIWNKLKVMAVARIMAVAYSFSLLTVALKCQISILASYICESFGRVGDPSWWSKYMGNYFGGGNDSNGFGHTTIDANAQQLFLKCIQYFTTQGVEELLNRIETICEEELGDISLKNEFDSDCLKELFETIKRRMQSIDTRHFSYLIVPKFADQDAFALPHSGDLQALLHRLIEMLESMKCKSVASSLIDFYLHAAIHIRSLTCDHRVDQK